MPPGYRGARAGGVAPHRRPAEQQARRPAPAGRAHKPQRRDRHRPDPLAGGHRHTPHGHDPTPILATETSTRGRYPPVTQLTLRHAVTRTVTGALALAA